MERKVLMTMVVLCVMLLLSTAAFAGPKVGIVKEAGIAELAVGDYKFEYRVIPPYDFSKPITKIKYYEAEWGKKSEAAIEKMVRKAIELAGETTTKMSMDSRFALCNLASDTGAKNAIIAPDDVTEAYLKGRARRGYEVFRSDPDAEYTERIVLDVSTLEPQVACPHSPDNVRPLSHVLGKKIQVATIASCSSGRLEDLHVAAEILKGRKVDPNVRMIISPASQTIFRQAMEDGTFATLMEAGVLISHSTCGPCHGGELVILADGEVCIGSLPRNMQGRLGSPKSEVYLANPAVVAASAIKGAIADPREFL